MNQSNDIESGVEKKSNIDVKNDTEDAEIKSNMTCLGYLKNDFTSPFFSLIAVNGNILDVKATIMPRSRWIVVTARFLFFIFSIISLAEDLKATTFLWIWMGFLTNWGLVYALVYQISILVCSFMPESKLCQSEKGEPNSLIIRFTLVMYEVAASTQMAVTVLYWVLIYSPDDSVNFANVTKHGIICLFLLIDGNIIGRIPVRWKHFVVAEFMNILYVIWNIIHSLQDIGIEERGNNLGQPLYDVLNWQDYPKSSTIMTLIVLFGLFPGLYLILWILSYVSNRGRMK